MVAEIPQGKDWNKEIVTSKNEVKGGPTDVKRTEFYEKRSDLKTDAIFNEVISDLAGKGYKTMNDLGSTGFYSHEIKSGDTLFPMLRDEFFPKKFPSMTAKQAEKESYLSLAFVMKENLGINVDDLKVGGKVEIVDGYLTVYNPDLKTKSIDWKPLRPVGPAVDVAPAPEPAAPAQPEVPAVTPVEPITVTDQGKAVPATPAEPVKVEEPTVPATPDVPVTPADPGKDIYDKVPPVAPEATKPVETTTKWNEEITKEEIQGGYTGEGQYTREDNATLAGTFEKGLLVKGKFRDDTWTSEGTYDKTSGNLIKGIANSVDGKIQETGVFANTVTNELLDGVRVVDGEVERVLPKATPTPELTEAHDDYVVQPAAPAKPEVPAVKPAEPIVVTDPNAPKIEGGKWDNGKLIEGKVIFQDGLVQEGKWDNGKLIDGKVTYSNNVVEEGKRDKETGRLIDGKATFPDGLVQEGKWDNGKLIDGKVTYSNNVVKEGKWDNGKLIEGKVIFQDGLVQEGKWDKETRRLIEGKVIFQDGLVQEGKWDKETGRLIDGKATFPDDLVVEGHWDKDTGKLDEKTVKYTYLEAKLVEIERKAASLKPNDAKNVGPYFNSGSDVKFRDGYIEWTSTKLDTLGSPEQAKQLAEQLNARYEKLADSAPSNTENQGTVAPVTRTEKVSE